MMRNNPAWLIDHQFQFYGSWTPESGKLQRGELGRVSGVYALVVDDMIRYIGKAKHLRGRVRSYNRYLVANPARLPRKAHAGIKSALDGKKIVSVYICIAQPNENVTELEAMWIQELRPDWNGT